MLNLKNTLDGYLKNVEVIGNTVQDTNILADIRSVGDKVEGQELYKIPVVSCGKNLNNTTIKRGNINTDTGLEVSGGNTILCTSDFIQAKPLTKYVVSSNLNISSLLLTCYNKNKDYLGFCNIYNGYFETKENTKYIKFRFKKYNNEEFTDLEVSNINIQFEEGTIATPYEPYQEDKLTILSPVQLEKVGDAEDRIIEKNGVWGVEKKIITSRLTSKLQWYIAKNDINIQYFYTQSIFKLGVNNRKIICNNLTVNTGVNQNDLNGFNQILAHKSQNYSDRLYITLDVPNVDELKKWLDDNHTFIKYYTDKTQFIPLPHDQQVKLRTFAGQTNIAFLTEIPGQIKAQVPKSLGATVNIHTEQIADLYNSLDRVKKLEEATVSTIETESSFTTVDATSNGYFENVKLEGKTLVNKFNKTSWKSYGNNNTLTMNGDIARLERTVADGNVCYMAVPSQNKLEINTEYTIVIPYYTGNLHQASLYDRGNGFALQVGMINFTGNVGKFRIRNDKLTFSNNIELLFYTGDIVGNYLEISSNILILEGDHTNNPPSYFEGLMSIGQDVEEVSVESVNENLFSSSLYKGVLATGTGEESSGTRYAISGYFICPYDSIYFGGGNVNQRVILHYDKNKNYIGFTLVNSNSYYTLPANSYYARIRLDINGTEIFDIDDTLKINLSRNNTEYIPHQSNKKTLLYYNPTTETWEKPILREWDTIEKHSDGKYYYHKRSNEITLNGGEGWSSYIDLGNTARCYFTLNTLAGGSIGFNAICNKFTQSTDVNKDAESMWITTNNNRLGINILKSKLSTQDVTGFKAWLQANPTTVVYQLAQEEVYECTNIDLMTYSGETNYIINSGAISPKSLLKVHNNISNVVKILQEKVSLLENTFIAGLKSVLSGDMYSLATLLYPEDFEQNDNTEQDIMVIPE